jgi:hypothetical protein
MKALAVEYGVVGARYYENGVCGWILSRDK